MYVNSTWHRKNRLSSHNGVYTVRIYINNTTCVWPRGIHKGLYSIQYILRQESFYEKNMMHCLEHFWDIVYILCLSVYPYVCIIVSLSIRLFVCLSICLFVCISLCPFVDLFVRQKVCLLVFWVFVCQKICIFVSCLSAFCLFVCLLVFPGLCLSENMQICLLSVSFLSLWLSVLSVYLSACLSVCLIPLSVWSLFLPVCVSDPSASLSVCVLLAGENWCEGDRCIFRIYIPICEK
jgi:hypothetical protein